MGLARDLAEFVVALDASSAPLAVQEKLAGCLLNGYGIALGSATTPYYRVASRAGLELDGTRAEGGASVLFTGQRASLGTALLANCALFHGRAQEDTCGTVHVGAIAIPLLTALVEANAYPMERLQSALLAAYEVGGLFDQRYGRITAAAGLRATPLYGTLSAAAAAGKLMALSVPQMESALANAASFTGGILQSFAEGTDEWRYQVGIAARNGHAAAALAHAASVSAAGAFEGSAGFVQAFVRCKADTTSLQAQLGREWSILRVTYKPYPVCAFNQTPVIAALALREKLAGRRPDRVRVKMNPFETTYAGMDSRGPFKSITSTLMSIPFCIASTLLYGVPDMRRMTTYDDRTVTALIDRIELMSDDQVPNLSAIIEADVDGGTLAHEQRMQASDYAFDWRAVSRLIRRVGAEQGVPGDVYDQLEDFVLNMANRSIGDVTQLFSPALVPVPGHEARLGT
jgi:2-methylcitrate dehydratase PrpD